jgi:hypothetical protein
MRVIYCIVLALCFSIDSFSQIERPIRSIRIAPMKKPDAPPAPTSETVSPAVIKYESSFDKKEEKLLEGFSLLPKKQERGIMDSNDPTLRNISEVHTQIQNDKLKSEGLSQEIVNSDVFLGEFIVYTDELSIRCRDYSAVDGDQVRIWLNDEIVVTKVGLLSGFQSFKVKLREGLNIVKIQALNIGDYFPNTGQFIFLDGNSKLVTNQNWGLNTGFNAIVRIHKKETLSTSEK